VNRKYLDFLVVAAIAVLALAAVLLQLNDWLRAVLSLPLVLVLPGYALAAALFPSEEISGQERLLFTFGGSLAIGVLGGLLLNLAPWGLNPPSWTVLLVAVTLVTTLVALVRRSRAGGATEARAGRWRIRVSPLQGALLAAAVLVAAGAVGVAQAGASQQPEPSFTQLWLLSAPEQGQASARLGFQSFEKSPANYRVQVKEGNSVLREWDGIELKPGEKWETSLTLPTKTQSGAITAELFRLDMPGAPLPYRSVQLQGVGATK